MLRSLIAAALAFAFLAIAETAAEANPRAVASLGANCQPDNNGRTICGQHEPSRIARGHATRRQIGGDRDPRPGRWCMWWLRRHLGIPKSAFPNGSYNLAAAGRYLGSPAGGPQVGAIVVWRHHVGIITGKTATGWVVLSGNDGQAVRERERSLRGAIAFRVLNRTFAGAS